MYNYSTITRIGLAFYHDNPQATISILTDDSIRELVDGPNSWIFTGNNLTGAQENFIDAYLKDVTLPNDTNDLGTAQNVPFEIVIPGMFFLGLVVLSKKRKVIYRRKRTSGNRSEEVEFTYNEDDVDPKVLSLIENAASNIVTTDRHIE